MEVELTIEVRLHVVRLHVRRFPVTLVSNNRTNNSLFRILAEVHAEPYALADAAFFATIRVR
jgi:hypothetical protein